MSTRVAKAADEEELPKIERVYKVTRREVSKAYDPFAEQGEKVKALDGVDSNARRRMTNEIKKYNRSADGKTESKQIDEQQTYTGYDAFGVVQPPYSMDAFIQIYELSPVHYAAVNAKVANIVGLGYKFVETTKTKRALDAITSADAMASARKNLELARDDLTELLEGFNEEMSFTEVLQRVWRDYEITGNGYLEVTRKRDGSIGYVGHVPAHTIRVRAKRDGFVQISGGQAVYFRNFGDNATNPIGSDRNPSELIHFMRYSPSSTYYGVPDVVAAQHAIAGNDFAAQYNLEYFENKAIPKHVITLKGADLSNDSISDILQFFETGLKGQNHRSLFIPLPPDDAINKTEFKIDTIEQGSPDAAFINYQHENRDNVLMAHRVPISKVSTASGASVALARDADKTFKEQVCQPEQSIAEQKVNRLIKELTDAFEFQLHEMSLTDTNTQSQIDERMVKNGIWVPNEVRQRDGMATLDGGDERVDLNAANKLKEQANEARAQGNRARDAERSANQTDSQASATGRNPKGEGRTTT